MSCIDLSNLMRNSFALLLRRCCLHLCASSINGVIASWPPSNEATRWRPVNCCHCMVAFVSSPDSRKIIGWNDQHHLQIWRAPSWDEIRTAEARDKKESP